MPVTNEKVTLALSVKKGDPYLTTGEVVLALERAGRSDLKDEFVKEVITADTFGDFLKVCEKYVHVEIV